MAQIPPPRRAKFLLHCFYATGHVLPMQAVAKALVDRGHEVVWLTSPTQEARVTASGARFVATEEVHKHDLRLQNADPQTLDEIIDVFLGGRLTAQVADFRRVLAGFDPDFFLIDALPFGAAALCELGEIKQWGTLGVVPMFATETAPKSTLGTLLRQPALWISSLNSQRAELGLAPLAPEQVHQYSPRLHIQASCPSLEYNQTVHQATHYVGPLVSPLNKSGGGDLPAWWDEVVASPNVVGITQGTFAMDPTSLIIPAIEALADDASLLLVAPSQHADRVRAALGGDSDGRLPANVRIAEWIPYEALLPQCRLLITNGGYGSVTQALAMGVPLICAGTSEDKKDTAARVASVGAGVDLETEGPSAGAVRGAVSEVLEKSECRAAAQRVGAELRALGGARRVCELLEGMVVDG